MIQPENDHILIQFENGKGGNLYFLPYKGIIIWSSKGLSSLHINYEEIDNIDFPPCSPEIQGFIFVITTRCNLKCKYCYSIQNKPLSMQPENPSFILSRYLRPDAKILFINFFGGEPTLEMDVIKNTVNYLRHHLKDKTIYLRITTNGLLNTEDLDYLIENGFSIVVSSDGSPDETSYFSKRKVARKIERTIKRLVEKKATFRVRCTVTSENLDSLPSAIKYWKSLGVEHVHIEPYHPFGTSVDALELLPSTDSFLNTFKYSLDVAENVELWVQTGIYMNLLTPSTYFCTGASGKFRVYNPDGSITTCYRVQSNDNCYKNFIIGNWKEIIIDDNKINQWKSNNEYLCHHSVEKMEECNFCQARMICGGGCLMRNLTQGGAINIPDPWICKVRRELLSDAIERTWFAIKSGRPPVVFGRFVFENKVINNPAMGDPPINTKNNLRNHQHIQLYDNSENIIDIYKAIGVERGVRESSIYQKISRAECI